MTKPASDLIQFNQQLDAIVSSDEARQRALQSDDPILRTAARLTNNSHPVLSIVARQNIWSSLARVVPKFSPKPSKIIPLNFMGWAGRVAAMFVIAIMATMIAQPVSADSLPGDALYPVKRGFETLQLAFANNPSAQVQAHLNHADERLREVQRLAPDSTHIEQTLRSALDSLTRANTIASDNAIFERDSHVTEQAITVLMTLEQRLETTQVSDEFASQVQTSLSPIMVNLPIEIVDTVEATPEAMAAGIDPNPESTESTDDTSIATTSDLETAVEQETLYTNAQGRVNVRNGAGTNFDVVGVATLNTPVTVIGENPAGDWIQVRLPNGTEGWIFNQLLADAPSESVGSGNNNTNQSSSDNSNGNANGNSNGNSNGNANGNSNGNRNGNGNGN